MGLTDTEREIVKTVVQQFLSTTEPTARTLLVKRFKDPDAIDDLVRSSVLKRHGPDQDLLPMTLAFEYCGDEDIQHRAKNSVETVIRVLQNLFEMEMEKTQFTSAEIETLVRMKYHTIEPEMTKLGLYLAQEFPDVLEGTVGNLRGTELTSVRINERIVKLHNIDSEWDDYVRQHGEYLQRRGQPIKGNPKEGVKARTSESPANQGILVLISHSSKDKVLAEALIDLLRSGLGLLARQIRCSSVDGYRLPAGAHAETQLRQEVNATRVLIGLITPSSLASPYVLFELGARWGGGNPMIPVLAGVRSDELRGPLSGLNALLCSEEAQLHQLLGDIGSQLNLPVQGADSYLKQVKALKTLSEKSSAGALRPSTQEEMVFEESVYWKRKSGQREGPYCPHCYEDKGKELHLRPGATKGTFLCGICKTSFRTSEYEQEHRAFQ